MFGRKANYEQDKKLFLDNIAAVYNNHRSILSEDFVYVLERGAELIVKGVDLNLVASKMKNGITRESLRFYKQKIKTPEEFVVLLDYISKKNVFLPPNLAADI